MSGTEWGIRLTDKRQYGRSQVPISLRACYAISSTDLGYEACYANWSDGTTYAKRGTDVECGATPRGGLPIGCGQGKGDAECGGGQEGTTPLPAVLRVCYLLSGTPRAYGCYALSGTPRAYGPTQALGTVRY
eukprot:287599-Rhodomonas_salina.2